MNTKTHTVITDRRQEAGPFESKEAAWNVVLHPFSCILSVERRTDGWYTVYIITTTTSTTTLCPDHGIVNPKKAKTRIKTTDGYPEAGPFETQDEAMGAFVPIVRPLVLSVELREDGWYRTYVVNSTTSTIYWGPECKPESYEYKRESWWRRILRRARKWMQ